MKLVYLEWQDAISNAEWFTRADSEKWSKESDWTVKEAGWLISETEDYVCIATSWKPEDAWTDEQFCNIHKIPKSWMKEYRTLIEDSDMEWKLSSCQNPQCAVFHVKE